MFLLLKADNQPEYQPVTPSLTSYHLSHQSYGESSQKSWMQRIAAQCSPYQQITSQITLKQKINLVKIDSIETQRWFPKIHPPKKKWFGGMEF